MAWVIETELCHQQSNLSTLIEVTCNMGWPDQVHFNIYFSFSFDCCSAFVVFTAAWHILFCNVWSWLIIECNFQYGLFECFSLSVYVIAHGARRVGGCVGPLFVPHLIVCEKENSILTQADHFPKVDYVVDQNAHRPFTVSLRISLLALIGGITVNLTADRGAYICFRYPSTQLKYQMN